MKLRWAPRLALVSGGDSKPVREELAKAKNTLYVSVPGPGRVEFTVVQDSEVAGHPVEVIVSLSSWEAVRVKDEPVFRSEQDGRSWKPEPEVGRAVLSMLSGVSVGDVTGETAASGLFDLLIHLEVELAGTEPWLSDYFPKMFKYCSDRLGKTKLKKVSGVMDS